MHQIQINEGADKYVEPDTALLIDSDSDSNYSGVLIGAKFAENENKAANTN